MFSEFMDKEGLLFEFHYTQDSLLDYYLIKDVRDILLKYVVINKNPRNEKEIFSKEYRNGGAVGLKTHVVTYGVSVKTINYEPDTTFITNIIPLQYGSAFDTITYEFTRNRNVFETNFDEITTTNHTFECETYSSGYIRSINYNSNVKAFKVIYNETISNKNPLNDKSFYQMSVRSSGRTFRVSFRLKENTPVYVALIDLKGRLVKKLCDKTMKAGNYAFLFSPRVSSGQYILKTTFGNNSFLSTMLILDSHRH